MEKLLIFTECTVKWVIFAGVLFSLYLRFAICKRKFNTTQITDKLYYTYYLTVHNYKLADSEFKTPQISLSLKSTKMKPRENKALYSTVFSKMCYL